MSKRMCTEEGKREKGKKKETTRKEKKKREKEKTEERKRVHSTTRDRPAPQSRYPQLLCCAEPGAQPQVLEDKKSYYPPQKKISMEALNSMILRWLIDTPKIENKKYNKTTQQRQSPRTIFLCGL